MVRLPPSCGSTRSRVTYRMLVPASAAASRICVRRRLLGESSGM